MPVHNGEKFIGQALESALGQADVQLDVIVVDDASTDDTRSVVSSFGDRVRYLLVEKQVRNIAPPPDLGIAEARGELISILHHDDYYLPGKLSRHAAVMALDHRIGLAYSAQRYVDSDGSPLWTLRSPVARRDYVVEGVIESDPSRPGTHQFCNAVVRRSAYAAVGPFAEDPGSAPSGTDGCASRAAFAFLSQTTASSVTGCMSARRRSRARATSTDSGTN